MNSLHRFTLVQPTCCGVCRNHAWAIGYAPRPNTPVLWLCNNETCLSLGKAAYTMSQKDLDYIELSARADASDAAGAYLEELGQTDLVKLTREQWLELFKRYDAAREQAMRDKIMGYAVTTKEAA